MKAADCVKVTTFVEVAPEDAFEVFTRETDLWWRRSPRYRTTADKRGTLRFEPGVGGRLVEAFDDGEVFEIGRVLVWEPASRLVLEWRLRNFARDEKTEVSIRFEPHDGGTRVTLEHRGWAAIREDHPARHGLTGPAFIAMIGLWWGELTTGLRTHAGKRSATR
jgi:activator of HSP90 ATPase